jgi:hypothetical protein
LAIAKQHRGDPALPNPQQLRIGNRFAQFAWPYRTRSTVAQDVERPSEAIVGAVEYGEPIAYSAVKPGADVISSDGQDVGAVEHVLADEDADVFDGIVIDVKSGPGGHRFVDAPEISSCHERAVVIAVSAADVEKLPEPGPNPAVMEHHGVEDSEGKLREKLHRAWDMISGNT